MPSKYQKFYDQIIERARLRTLDCYSEWHHVLPRSLGGGDEDNNLVQLTYREHFLVHWLLTKIYNEGRGRRSMIYALMCMGTMSANGQRIVTSWQFDVAKRTIKNHFMKIYEGRIREEEIKREIYLQKIGVKGLVLAGKRKVRHRGKRINQPLYQVRFDQHKLLMKNTSLSKAASFIIAASKPKKSGIAKAAIARLKLQ